MKRHFTDIALLLFLLTFSSQTVFAQQTSASLGGKGRLLVTLDIEAPERVYVSKNKAAEFKAWIVRDSG